MARSERPGVPSGSWSFARGERPSTASSSLIAVVDSIGNRWWIAVLSKVQLLRSRSSAMPICRAISGRSFPMVARARRSMNGGMCRGPASCPPRTERQSEAPVRGLFSGYFSIK